MMPVRRALDILDRLDRPAGQMVRIQLGLGRVLDAQRVLTDALDDGALATEVIASLVRAGVGQK